MNLAGRDLYENDFLSFNLGSGAISEIPLEIICYVTDNDFTVILEEAAVCNTENLDDVQLKFLKDITTREFFVHFKHLKMPEYATPGVVATFKFNGDYSAFASTELPYGNLQLFTPMAFPLKLEMDFDGKGQRADLLLTITPN